MRQAVKLWIGLPLTSFLISLAVSQSSYFSLQEPAEAQTARLQISLPNIAIVTLRDGREMSGKLLDINAQSLTLLRGSQETLISLSQVAETNGRANITFDVDSPFHEIDTERVIPRIRGEAPFASAVGTPRAIGPVPWSQFRLADPVTGRVEIEVPSGSAFSSPPGVTPVADQLQINLQGNQIGMQVTPYQLK